MVIVKALDQYLEIGIREKGKTQDVGSGANLNLTIIYNKSERYLNSITSYWNQKIFSFLASYHREISLSLFSKI